VPSFADMFGVPFEPGEMVGVRVICTLDYPDGMPPGGKEIVSIVVNVDANMDAFDALNAAHELLQQRLSASTNYGRFATVAACSIGIVQIGGLEGGVTL